MTEGERGADEAEKTREEQLRPIHHITGRLDETV
jgi:hypothetical protein